MIDKCPYDLLLKDYIKYFLNKYNENNIFLEDVSVIDIKSSLSSVEDDEEEKIKEDDDNYDFEEEIIEEIIAIKYKNDANIIKENEDKEFNKFLIKIIWLEANKNYILTIIDLFEKAKNTIYGNKKKKIYY